jgi:small-conductance mechanosensitive channel
MNYTKRPDELQFKVGDPVEINSIVLTRFSGLKGTVIKIVESKHARNLDRYTVRFENGEERDFWNFQFSAPDPALASRLPENVQQL